MIPFDELARALEAYRRRKQTEDELAGPPEDSGGGNGRYDTIQPENTNEIDVNQVDIVDENEEPN